MIELRIFALELNNDIKGLQNRKEYIESLIAQLPNPDLVLLPELAVCSYMANQDLWQYADHNGQDTSAWAMSLAKKYNTDIGAGYLDYEKGDYYNRYLIAGKDGIFGVVTKSEGESAAFKRGSFGNLIKMPFGNVAVGICYDAKRKHLYDNIKNEEIALIVFPHGCPADPKRADEEIASNNLFCGLYQKAYDVPVVYVNSIGKLEYMPGKMGRLMQKAGFTMNGRSKIYSSNSTEIPCQSKEGIGTEAKVFPHRRIRDIPFNGDDLIKGNWLFRFFILKPDVQYGIKLYEKNVK